MAVLQFLLKSLMVGLGLYVFYHDFENPKRPCLGLRYALTWCLYLFFIGLFVLFVLVYSLPFRQGLTEWLVNPKDKVLFGLLTGLVLVSLVLVLIMTRTVLKRRRYYRQVKRKAKPARPE